MRYTIPLFIPLAFSAVLPNTESRDDVIMAKLNKIEGDILALRHQVFLNSMLKEADTSELWQTNYLSESTEDSKMFSPMKLKDMVAGLDESLHGAFSFGANAIRSAKENENLHQAVETARWSDYIGNNGCGGAKNMYSPGPVSVSGSGAMNCTWTLFSNSSSYAEIDLDVSDMDCENSSVMVGGLERCGDESSSKLMMSLPADSTHAGQTRGDITFKTNSTSHSGFGFTWRESTVCTETVVLTEPGYIDTPAYPSKYGPNLRCNWNITAPEGSSVEFTVEGTFKTESCSYDYFTVSSSTVGSTPYKFCGEVTDATSYTSNSNVVNVHFTSDGGAEYQGGRLRVSFVDRVVDPCQGGKTIKVALGDSGVITSPNHPNNYPSNSVCNWNFDAEDDVAIEYRLDGFSFESSSSCSYDYVTFNEESTKYCSETTAPMNGILSTLQFKSDGSTTATGFKLHWTAIDHSSYVAPVVVDYTSTGIGCDSMAVALSGKEGIIHSPCYPSNYHSSMQKQYDFVDKASNEFLVLSIDDFQLEGSDSCSYDYVKIGLGIEPMGAKFCGSNTPDEREWPFNSISFHSDGSGEYKGFSGTWKLVAHEIITTTETPAVYSPAVVVNVNATMVAQPTLEPQPTPGLSIGDNNEEEFVTPGSSLEEESPAELEVPSMPILDMNAAVEAEIPGDAVHPAMALYD